MFTFEILFRKHQYVPNNTQEFVSLIKI